MKISQSINTKCAYDRNKKSMYSWFYEGKRFLSRLMYSEGKKQEIVKMYVLKLLVKFFVNMEEVFMADILPNGLQEWTLD